jgi:glutamine synthetase
LKEILKTKTHRDEAIMEFVRQSVGETKTIRFAGNGYSDEWKVEAKKRGLPILNTTADALAILADKKATHFLVATKVLTAEEIASRYHISVERYIKTLDLEHETLIELVSSYVIPTLDKQLVIFEKTTRAIVADSLKKAHTIRKADFETVFADVLNSLKDFKEKVEASRLIHNEPKRMKDIVTNLQPTAEALRKACDAAENLVANDLWPLPKYREMLLANTLS